MNKQDFCEKYNLTLEQFSGEEWFYGDLTIDEEVLPEGLNPKVAGHLKLINLKVIPFWFNPVVRAGLYLPSVTSFDPSFDPVVSDWLELNALIEIPYGWKPTVGFLCLNSITTLPEWFEPTAWAVTFFNGVIGLTYTKNFRPENGFFSWRDGQYVKVDWIITEVVEKRDKVFHVKGFGEDKIFYLVTDGNGTFAHGNTLSEAKADLKFKLAKRGGVDKYRSLTLESVLSFDELTTMYRLITGVCSFGVNKFIEENKIEKKSYSIGEVITLTNGKYGSEIFKNFFNYD